MTPIIPTEEDFRLCSCIALNHQHKPGRCDEPPTYRGGVCHTCRYADTFKGSR